VGRGQTGISNLPKNLPPGVAHRIAQLATEVFHHAFLNAMKPSLAIPIIAMAAGAIVTLFMQGGARAGTGEQERPRETGLAAAGE
jgi:hypothetical protein